MDKNSQLAGNYSDMFKPKNIVFNASVKVCLIAGIMLVSSSILFSQSTYDNPQHSDENFMSFKTGWFMGVDAGYTLFYGDISLYNNFPKFKDFHTSAGRGFGVLGGKKFRYGLSAEAELFKGTLKGEKRADKLYPRYFNADITSYSVSAKYNLTQLLFRKKSDRSFFNRLTIYVNVGCGQTFFRSRLYKYASNNQWYLENVSGYNAASIDSVSLNSGGGIVTDKAKVISAVILPIGGKFNFKLNSKTDLYVNATYTTVFSDEVDAWTRDWSHKDRYLYTGIGLIFNFTPGSEIPESDRFFRPGSKKKRSRSTSSREGDSEDKYRSSDNSGKGLFNKGGKKEKEDKELEIRLKLYELQLKLFEMQFLIK